ncbi:hypothetical protein RA19_24710 [Leisingera sp. ANG-M1]|nr:hypothetical protein RA19_24710 [Leisingera sp. ANG-M1]
MCFRNPATLVAARKLAFAGSKPIALVAPSDVRDLAELADENDCEEVWTDLPDLENSLVGADLHLMPTIAPPDRQVHNGDVYLRTGGSTGRPKLVLRSRSANAAEVSRVLDRFGRGLPRLEALVSTVPFEHMFGYTLGLQLGEAKGIAMQTRRPVFPADLRNEIAEVRNRNKADKVWLVTTPTHLRSYGRLKDRIEHVAGIVSATSPMDPGLAIGAKKVFGAPILEIYGSTETGAVASRVWDGAETDSPVWTPLTGAELTVGDDNRPTWILENGQASVTLNDLVSREGQGFRLLGRADDALKVAGKQQRLGTLTHLLGQAPGVRDGAYVKLDDSEQSAEPVLGMVVALEPGGQVSTVLDHLSGKVDPVFLPRRIAVVDRLPRTETGKLRKSDGQQVLARHGRNRHEFQD